MIDDYHVTQLTGTTCAPRNCAAASGAMGLFVNIGIKITADRFRTESGVSCVPGVHSTSGGLFISDVIRVFTRRGATIDYGVVEGGYTRWAPPELSRRCGSGYGAVLLGDYDALPSAYRASRTFLGDHSAWVHDYRPEDQTICWHDPIRKVGIRIPISAAIAYWQKPGSPIRGYAGFVRDARLPDTGTEEIDMAINAVSGITSPYTVKLTQGTDLFDKSDLTDRRTEMSTTFDVTYLGIASDTAIAVYVTTGGKPTILYAKRGPTPTLRPPEVVDCSDAVAVAREKDRTAMLAAVGTVFP